MELDKAIEEIARTGAKTVLVQVPAGLRPEATGIYDALKLTGARVYIWAGSCFGYCDLPAVRNIDLLVQFGHNLFRAAAKAETDHS